MAGTKGDETIVEGSEEIEGKKRVNSDLDSCPEKRENVEGEAGGDGTKEEEELNNKVERLRGLLADDPKKLSKEDVEQVISSLNVDEIMSLALKSYQGKERDDGGGIWKENEDWCARALSTVRLMLVRATWEVKTADIRLVYEKWPASALATVLLAALDLSAFRKSGDPSKMVDYHDIIPKLCRVLPFKLFAHVLHEKEVFYFDDEIDEEEIRRRQKKAAEDCDFCFGKAEHKDSYGGVCTLMEAVPKGTVIPPGYRVECWRCDTHVFLYTNSFEGCLMCDGEVARALPISPSNLSLSDLQSTNWLHD